MCKRFAKQNLIAKLREEQSRKFAEVEAKRKLQDPETVNTSSFQEKVQAQVETKYNTAYETPLQHTNAKEPGALTSQDTDTPEPKHTK